MMTEYDNDILTRVLANISHELRNPLTAVMGFADQLATRTDLTEEHRRKFLRAIQKSARNLTDMINGFLDLSTLSNDSAWSEVERFDLIDVINAVTFPLSVEAEEKGLVFEFACVDDLPRIVKGYPAGIKTILYSLISNAIKFTDNGIVSVMVELANKDQIDDHKVMCKFRIEDSGIGVLPEDVDAIFERFIQSDASPARRYGGAGIGLNLARSTARKLGGEVEYLGRGLYDGTHFEAYLPVIIDQDERIKTLKNEGDTGVEATKMTLQHIRVLVVEDGVENQMLFREILRYAGADVIVASGAQEAYTLVEQQTFHVIFMDMQMPEIDGYEATSELRSRGVRTPIVALTAHVLPQERERCLAAGCDDYRSKPISVSDFVNTAHRWANQSCSISSIQH